MKSAGWCLTLGLALVAPWTAVDAAVDEAASAACVKCHDVDDLPDMSRSAHVVLTDPRIPSCVTCHGPSPTHVNKPEDVEKRPRPDRVFRKKGSSSAEALNTACLSCHEKDARRMLWRGSAHDTAEVTCSNCHRIHANRDPVLIKTAQLDVCAACHKEQRAQVMRPSHHPIPEGKMSCADCHNAHGSAGANLMRRDSTNDTCFLCHAEKRGPFVHPHEPVVDDCATCHNPHGSNVAAMLKARAPMLCQQCHTPHVASDLGAVGGERGVFTPSVSGAVPPAVTGLSSGKNVVNFWQGRSCLNCHTQVHGSNNPAATNPTPQLLLR